MSDNLENRLDQLGAAAAGEIPALDESSAFLAHVRRRGRARALRNTLVAGCGVALAAAALLLAALLNPPRSAPTITPVPGPAGIAADLERPTFGNLSRAAWTGDNLDEVPALHAAGGSRAIDENPWTAGSARSKKLTSELLAGL